MAYMQFFLGVRRHKVVLTVLVALFVLQLVVGCVVIYLVGLAQTHSFMNGVVDTAKSDIVYHNGQWDTSAYDSDPDIPGNYRIYVISRDGFIIDRWRPISGYLDTSDLKQLLAYQTPTTVHTVAGQTWRLLSLSLSYRGANAGVVTVGKTIPPDSSDDDIDAELQTAANSLASKITVGRNSIDTHELDDQSVAPDISFQIVDQYNRIALKSDHSSSVDALPNYIDPSYISGNLQAPSFRMIHTSASGGPFLVESTPLIDGSGDAYGTIIVARTVEPYIQLMDAYLWLDGLIGAILFVGAAFALIRYTDGRPPETVFAHSEPIVLLSAQDIERIVFSKEDCTMQINGERIPITYATNQYYMVRTLFAKPYKKWEVDELVDKFGLEPGPGAWRKIYDAMASLNKKAAEVMEPRLIITTNKTYQVNPKLAPLISKLK